MPKTGCRRLSRPGCSVLIHFSAIRSSSDREGCSAFQNFHWRQIVDGRRCDSFWVCFFFLHLRFIHRVELVMIVSFTLRGMFVIQTMMRDLEMDGTPFVRKFAEAKLEIRLDRSAAMFPSRFGGCFKQVLWPCGDIYIPLSVVSQPATQVLLDIKTIGPFAHGIELISTSFFADLDTTVEPIRHSLQTSHAAFIHQAVRSCLNHKSRMLV